MDDELDLRVEGASRTGIALIIIAAALLAMVVYLFHRELGLVPPDVDVSVPTEIPDGAYSAADRPAPAS